MEDDLDIYDKETDISFKIENSLFKMSSDIGSISCLCEKLYSKIQVNMIEYKKKHNVDLDSFNELEDNILEDVHKVIITNIKESKKRKNIKEKNDGGYYG